MRETGTKDYLSLSDLDYDRQLTVSVLGFSCQTTAKCFLEPPHADAAIKLQNEKVEK